LPAAAGEGGLQWGESGTPKAALSQAS